MKFEANFLTFDLETGGLKSEENPVLEVAFFAMDKDLNEIDSYNSLIKPYGKLKITDGALKANGLNLETLEEKGKECKEVAEDLVQFFIKHKKRKTLPILCGHNIEHFDIPFLDQFMNFCGKDISKLVNNDFIIDTLWWSRIRWVESINYKLVTCCDNAGIELINAHRAVADTKANQELVRYFLNSLRSGQSSTVIEKRFREEFEF
jgi:DNA polymerase III alpha subunit (gram-positive type)